jgi:hypothetical protein
LGNVQDAAASVWRASLRMRSTMACRPLRRQVLVKSEFVEHRDGIGRKNLLRRLARIKREQDRDQAADDMHVAVEATRLNLTMACP